MRIGLLSFRSFACVIVGGFSLLIGSALTVSEYRFVVDWQDYCYPAGAPCAPPGSFWSQPQAQLGVGMVVFGGVVLAVGVLLSVRDWRDRRQALASSLGGRSRPTTPR
jgi:hypothetical protein